MDPELHAKFKEKPNELIPRKVRHRLMDGPEIIGPFWHTGHPVCNFSLIYFTYFTKHLKCLASHFHRDVGNLAQDGLWQIRFSF